MSASATQGGHDNLNVTNIFNYLAALKNNLSRLYRGSKIPERISMKLRIYNNSSGDEIANVNFYAVRPEATRIR